MAKLASGIRKRDNGSYEKRFSVNGKRYSVYGKTYKEVTAKEHELREQIERGTYTNNANVTLDTYYTEWKKNHAARVKGSTMYTYDNRYMKHIKPYLGNKKVKTIERRSITEWQHKLIEDGATATTANYSLKIVKIILGDAVKDGILFSNVAASVDAIRVTDKKAAAETIHRALTLEEQKSFMEELKDSYYYDVFAFLLTTGMRSGEAAALTWGDIDRVNKQIHITKTTSVDASGNRTTCAPKSKTSKRDIPLTDTHLKILAKTKEKNLMLFGAASLATDHRIFLTNQGNEISTNSLRREIERTLDALDSKGTHIEYFAPHALRDTFATRFIEQGGAPQTLKTILGHANLSMTMDLYAHVLPNTKAEEMNRITIAI